MHAKFHPSFLLLIFIFSLLFSSCQTTTSIDYSDTLSLLEENRIREKEEYKDNPLDFESSNMLARTVGVFYVFPREEVPKDSQISIAKNIFKQVQNTQFFDQVLDEDEADKSLKKDLELYYSKSVYLDSLASVSVSDKEISNPVGKALNIDQLIVFQMDLWPCDSCIAKNIMRMKLRLVDLDTGAIIWTGIHEMTTMGKALSDPDLLAIGLSSTLVDTFYHRFRKKWHKLRFFNLKGPNS